MDKQLLIYYHVSYFEKNHVHQISKIVNIFLNESFCNSFRPLITIIVSANSSILHKYKIWHSERKWSEISSFLPLLFLVVYQQELSQEFVWTTLENWTNPQLGQKKKKKGICIYYYYYLYFSVIVTCQTLIIGEDGV